MENPFHLMMNPKSIATAGAGNNLTKMGTLCALTILTTGYQGKFYPVHPKEERVLGHKTYPSVFDLPEPPDLAVLIVHSDLVVRLLEDFGKIGTKRAIICSAGFKETGLEGKKKEDQLNEVADKYGLRFVGPNCMGIINSQIKLNTTVMPISLEPGTLGVVSQSGTYVAQCIDYLKKRGIRYSKAFSIGNEANMDIVDALEYLGEDEQTKAIALYIEGIRDGQRFMEVAQKITPKKPVVALYVGGSDAGARAASSHTGAMAGPDLLYEGIFKQAGIIRVRSFQELYDYGWALATQPPLKGNRIGIITNSGGPGASMSHECNNSGMEIPRLSDRLQSEIRQYLPSHASSENPVDLTFIMDPELLCNKLPNLLMNSNEVDGVLLHGVMAGSTLEDMYPGTSEKSRNIPDEDPAEESNADLITCITLPKKYNKPLLLSCFFDRDIGSTKFLQDNNIPVYYTPEEAARSMLSLYRHLKVRGREKIIPPQMPEIDIEAKMTIQNAMNRGQKALDEHEAKQVLSAYGIPVTKEEIVQTQDDALSAANSIGFPVVLKGCSSDIMHKTEQGLIHIDLKSDTEVLRSFNAIRNSANDDIPVLIQEMVPGNRELLCGMSRFPGFGPCILFGIGGIFTEVLNDTTFRSAPLSLEEAHEMIFDIKSGVILKEFRGMASVDTSILADILQKIGFISLLHPEISEIDLNPIIINGSQPVVVDALFVLS